MNIFTRRRKELEAFKRAVLNRKREHQTAQIPDNLFEACPSCGKSYLQDKLQENLYVCPDCGFHIRIGARERISQLCDSFRETDKTFCVPDKDFPGYSEKLDKARDLTGLRDACVCGVAKIGEQRFMLCVMDSRFMMGSMGQTVGEKIVRTVEGVIRRHLPLVIFTTSGGARMQEGILSLIQMARTSAALEKLSEEQLPYISILTDPTTGGVSASFAMLADIILAEPGALIGFAGRRVIASTVREELPEDFQRAEFLLEKGFVDRIVDRRDLKDELGVLLSLHERRPLWT